MNILAFDTCWGACSAAVLRADRQPDANRLTARLERMATGQAEVLPVMLASVLAEAGLAPADIDRIAVAVGPGSFTGIRIAIAAARAFRLATGADTVTASSLAVIAYGLADNAAAMGELENRGSDILVAMDARRDQAYVQLFSDQGLTEKTVPELLPIEDAARLGGDGAARIVGTAAQAISELATSHGRRVETLAVDVVPDAANLAEMARNLMADKGLPTPLYIRPPDARPQSGQHIPRTSA